MQRLEMDRVIAELRTDVQRLAARLHEAKKQVDWTRYTWLGLDKTTNRENFERYSQLMPESNAALETLRRHTEACRNARASYFLRKAQLEDLEAEREMKANPSIESVAACYETVLAADTAGWDDLMPGRRTRAMKAARETAIALRDEARRTARPANRDDQIRLVQHELMVQIVPDS